MALTRKMLKALGIEDDKIDQIIESHSETVESLKNEAASNKEAAGRVPELEKQIEELEAKVPDKDYKAEYDKLNSEYEDFKAKTATEEANREKADLYRALLRKQGVDEKRLDTILKVTDLSKLSVKDGAIEDEKEVAEAIGKEWGDFIGTTSTQGAGVDNPPGDNGGEGNAPNGRAAELAKQFHERRYGKPASTTKEE